MAPAQNRSSVFVAGRPPQSPRNMQSQDQATKTSWSGSALDFHAPPLRTTIAAEVCVVGAGVTGLTTAYVLGRAGVSSVTLEAGTCGGGETLRSTAQLSSVSDHGLVRLERLIEPARARLAARSHALAIDALEEIVHAEEIDCAFSRLDGFVIPSPSNRYEALLEELLAAQRAELGAELLPELPGGPGTGQPVLRFPGQAQLDPARYLHGLLERVRQCELSPVFGRSRVAKIEASGGRVRVTTADGGRVEARHVVVATNHPANVGMNAPSSLRSYRTYALAAEFAADAAPPPALFWDMDNPAHHARIVPGLGGTGALLLAGGEDHPTGCPPNEAPLARLERWARRLFPALGAVTHRWSGQVVETPDGLACIGPTSEHPHIHLACGDCGRGFTHGMLAALILRDRILGRDNPWQGLYDPRRKQPVNIPTRWQAWWNLARHRVRRLTAFAPAPDRVPPLLPGCGRLEQHASHKVAVYRTLEGRRVERSAVCPHDGVLLSWNPLERTWDCPCDGSRFAPTGEVLHGPAIFPLDPAPLTGPPRAARSSGHPRGGEHL